MSDLRVDLVHLLLHVLHQSLLLIPPDAALLPGRLLHLQQHIKQLQQRSERNVDTVSVSSPSGQRETWTVFLVSFPRGQRDRSLIVSAARL